MPPSTQVYGSVTGMFSIVMNEQPIGVPNYDKSLNSVGKNMMISLAAGTG